MTKNRSTLPEESSTFVSGPPITYSANGTSRGNRQAYWHGEATDFIPASCLYVSGVWVRHRTERNLFIKLSIVSNFEKEKIKFQKNYY